jgi:hypothetical protein
MMKSKTTITLSTAAIAVAQLFASGPVLGTQEALKFGLHGSWGWHRGWWWHRHWWYVTNLRKMESSFQHF